MRALLSYGVPIALFFVLQSHAQAGAVQVEALTPMDGTSTSKPGLESWKKEGVPTVNDHSLWEKGASPEDLLRRDTAPTPSVAAPAPNTLGPTQPVNTGQASGQEDPNLQLAGGAIKGDSEAIGSSWRRPTSEAMAIDENPLNEGHEVYGAYGQMVKDEDFKMSVGPELHVPEDSGSILGESGPDNSELGVGMKLQWGF